MSYFDDLVIYLEMQNSAIMCIKVPRFQSLQSVPLSLKSQLQRGQKNPHRSDQLQRLGPEPCLQYVPSWAYELDIVGPSGRSWPFSRFIEEDPIQTGILQSNSAVKFCGLLCYLCFAALEWDGPSIQFLYITSSIPSIGEDQRIHCIFENTVEAGKRHDTTRLPLCENGCWSFCRNDLEWILQYFDLSWPIQIW